MKTRVPSNTNSPAPFLAAARRCLREAWRAAALAAKEQCRWQ